MNEPEHTKFCSAVIKSRRVHFACMKTAVAVHAKRGFCKEHAPAFETFYVYRVDSSGQTDKVLVFQPPGVNHSFTVVSPSDRKHGSTLWGSAWFRTLDAARNAPLMHAVTRVREAKRDLRERERDLNKIRGAK